MDFIKKNRDAPASMATVAQEISDLSICVAQLQPFVNGFKHPTRSQKDAVSVEQVVVIMTSCVVSLSDVEKLLDSFDIFHFREPMLSTKAPWLDRYRWSQKEPELVELMYRVQASRASLDLILTIFNT